MLAYRDLTNRIVGLAIEVHRTIGPGLPGSVYAGGYSKPQVGWDTQSLSHRHGGRRPTIHAWRCCYRQKAWMAALRPP